MKQGSAEWFSARTGRLTASNMAAAMSYLKNGQDSAERKALKKQVLAERLTDIVVPHYVTPHMQHGIDTEPEAKAAYVAKTGARLIECGFIEHPFIEWFGSSPDSLLGADGVLECKCPSTVTHLAYLEGKTMPEQYKPQVLAQLACTGRRYCDFVSFDPRIKDERLRLFIVRYEPTAAEIENVENEARKFLAEVDAMFEQLTTEA